ncbi:penicillin amidase family protein [hydrothermal vent metagenome]|uniref:Penicillin amidase family protein n=1 Tax=hydrothermal vent metagenome TaxID=652676 RepID=A0A3B0RLU4_9ZZZZ
MRVMELTDGQSPIGAKQLLTIKFDHGYAKNSVAANIVAQVLAHDWSEQPELQKAANHLAKWDLQMDIANRFAALGGLTVMPQITAEFTGEPVPTPIDAFTQAVRYLKQTHGRIDPKWGEVNRLVRGGLNLPIDGGPDTLRAIYPKDFGKNGQLEAAAGDTWIALVTWDKTGQQSAQIIHQFGSATLDQSSPHYNDQAPLFVAKKWRTALRTRAEIEQNASRTYRPE